MRIHGDLVANVLPLFLCPNQAGAALLQVMLS